jgi:glycosyltransferase involved in cell wall biosynthesis
MKILFLNYEYPPLGGGAANATAYILEEWAKEGQVEAHLVTSALGSTPETLEVSGKVFVHRIPIGKNPDELHRQTPVNLLRYTWSGFFTAYRMVRTAKKEGVPFDACLAFFTVPSGFQAFLLRICTGLPYVVALRGSDVPGYNIKYTKLYIVLRPFIRRIWASAARVIANSEGLRELARKTAPRQPIDVIPNGVDTERYHPDPAARPSGRFIVTPGASRITERKGLRFLVQAIAMLKPEYPELEAVILGDGAGRAELEAEIKEKNVAGSVRLVGRVPREETPRSYQEASVFVLPSSNEGMSNALLEGLASGLPAVVTDIGGTRELVSEENGFIVPIGSGEAIADALRTLLDDPALRERLGEASRRRAEAMSWRSVAESFRKALV